MLTNIYFMKYFFDIFVTACEKPSKSNSRTNSLGNYRKYLCIKISSSKLVARTFSQTQHFKNYFIGSLSYKPRNRFEGSSIMVSSNSNSSLSSEMDDSQSKLCIYRFRLLVRSSSSILSISKSTTSFWFPSSSSLLASSSS